MTQRFAVVDAFTDRPFAGNPAAVCILEKPADEQWMRSVASEMNLSETAFLVAEADGFRLRWLTPVSEVDLCGHATLASAHVLWEDGRLASNAEARFYTRSGRLTARREGDLITMDFPAKPAERCAAPMELGQALGAEILWAGRNGMDFLIEVASEAIVRGLRPDHRAVAELPVRGVIVTARSEEGRFDFVSRFFAPAEGIPEDPVTGSAHCALGPFWGARLGKTALCGNQVSTRGGEVRVTLNGERVTLAGKAVTVSRGEILGSLR